MFGRMAKSSWRDSSFGISRILTNTLFLLSVVRPFSSGFELNVDDRESLKRGASIAAQGMMNYYSGDKPGGTPGILPGPYYWWEVGAMFGGLIDFWWYTGNDTYNDAVTQGMLHQIGDDGLVMPKNQTQTEGNDDQAFWAIAAMGAAERNFPNPPADKPQWLATVQAVFNLQATRWDDAHCDGGLRWQIFTWNNGFNYKNTVSNGCFFHIAARLARYTGNSTYNEWAHKVWDWTYRSGLMTDDFRFYDGLDMITNCSVNHNQWSYNAGLYLAGAAAMYNITTGEEQELWKNRTDGILYMTGIFFNPNVTDVMYEAICEPYPRGCNTDQKSFKAYLSRWYALTSQLAPHTAPIIMQRLRASARAAANTCIGGNDGVTCGVKWYLENQWDGSYGVGEQMSAMEVIQSNLIPGMPPPFTMVEGTSEGDPAAGGSGDNPQLSAFVDLSRPTAGQKAAAGILTVFGFFMCVGTGYYMVA